MPLKLKVVVVLWIYLNYWPLSFFHMFSFVTVNGSKHIVQSEIQRTYQNKVQLVQLAFNAHHIFRRIEKNMHYSCSLLITPAERTLATQASVVWHGFIIGCSTLLSALHKATMLNWWSHKMLVGHSRSCISAVSFFSTVQFKCHFDYKKNISNF